MIRRYLSILLIALYIVTVFSPVVNADASASYTSQKTFVDLKPGRSDAISNKINLMNESEIQQEKDIIFADLPQGTEGKYYGSYLPASEFQFATNGGFFQFVTNFSISNSVIMNGVSSFWLRIPIVPSQYQYWHLFCSWDADSPEVFLEMNCTVGGALNEEVYKMVLPWYMPSTYNYWFIGHDFTFGLYEQGLPGNVWSVSNADPSTFLGMPTRDPNGMTDNIIETDNGIYVFMQGSFLPDKTFSLAFTGCLKSEEAPIIFLTGETEIVNDTQDFRFFQPALIKDSVGDIVDFQYDYDLQKTIPLKPAWDFVFVSGIGKEGMVSYKFSFQNEWITRAGTPVPTVWSGLGLNIFAVQYLRFYQTITKVVSTDRALTFYLPFTILHKDNSSTMNKQITWDILMHISGGTGFPAFNISGNYNDICVFSVSHTENYLLVSVPYPVERDHIIHGGLCDDWTSVIIDMYFAPVEDCSIRVLGSDEYIDTSTSNLRFTAVGKQYISSAFPGTSSAFNWDALRVGNFVIPIVYCAYMTYGSVASITPTKLFTIYDFGWGKGYEYPGNSSLYFFLDDGGQYFLTAKQKDIIDGLNNPNDNRTELQTIWDAIRNSLNGFVGFIFDGISWVWDTLVSIGTWISNTLQSIWGWIVSAVTDIVNKVGNIIEGMLYGFPIMGVLFIVYYAGRYFSTGNIPNPVKEGRKLKRRLVRIQKRVSKAMPHTTAEAKFIKSKTITPAYEKAKGYAPRGRIERRVERMSYRKTHPAEYTYNRVTTGHQARKQSRKWRRERRGAE